MKCLVCYHEMTERNIMLDLRLGEELMVIEGVPATVCEHCGEQVFSPETTRKVQTVAKERKGITRVLTVPVFPLEAAEPSAV